MVVKKEYSCDQCENFYGLKRDLKLHKQTHSSLPIFKCAMCPKVYTRNYTLKRHMKSHTGECIKCDLCRKLFSNDENLVNHIERHHAEVILPHNTENQMDIKFNSNQCNVCDKWFLNPYNMIRHKKIHERKSMISAISHEHIKKCQQPGPILSRETSTEDRGLLKKPQYFDREPENGLVWTLVDDNITLLQLRRYISSM